MGRGGLSLLFVLALLLPLRGHAQGPPTGPAPQVRDVAVQGNRRVQEAVILGKIGIKVGQPFSPARLAEDIRSVFSLGFFDDVQAKAEDFEGGVKVTFVVLERPFIRDLQFAGQKRLDAAALQDKSEIKLGAVYNPVEVTQAVERLKDHYEDEGYFEVSITPDVQRLPDGDVSVTFRIVEGRKISIDQVVIEGAKGVTPKQIKAVMGTQERQYYILRGTVQRQRLDDDVDRILQLYNDHGFIQARVDSTEIRIDRDKALVVVLIKVTEGPQFHVGGIDVTGNNILPEEEIRRRIQFKSGDVFSRAMLRDSLKGITDLYSAIGRASAEVYPNSAQDTPNLRVNLTFEINEGPEVFVERINITGNTRTEEKILRREVPLQEGDLFTSQKLARARQKLTNLGYFDKVNATTTPGSSKDKIVVTIDVTERPTGLFSLGGGFSSTDGFVATLDLSQRNFLGKGWEVFLRLRAGLDTQQGTIGFTEPWLFDRPLAAGFDIFNNRRVFNEYTVNSLGGDVRMGHPIGEYSRWNLIYRLTQDDISDVADNASTSLLREEGKRITSLIGGSLSRDTRDSAFEPTKGTTSSVALDFAGVGFGDSKFVRGLASAAGFYNPWLEHVISGRISAGYAVGWAEDPVPLFERFYLGGPNSIRSRKLRQVSPTDGSGTRIGGNSQVLGNIEYLVPLFFGIRGALFYDVGNVYGPDVSNAAKFDITDLRHAAGIGFRWASPFGPLRVDYGLNLDRRTGEKFGEFHFSVGSPF